MRAGGFLRRGGDARELTLDPCALPVGEEKQLVPDDAPAQVSAILILDVLRLDQTVAIGEEISRVEYAVSQVLVNGAMKLVGAPLGGDTDGRSGLAAQFGRGRWRKLKGTAMVRLRDGSTARAELHWYEAHGVGRRKFKIKRFLE